MMGLLVYTIFTSAADSLNPIGITQQVVLQGMVKKPKHIWYFIIPTGVVNLIGGFLAYYGFVTLIGNFLSTLAERYGKILFATELILGMALIFTIGFKIKNNKKSTMTQDHNKNLKEEAVLKIKSVSKMALITLGVGATIMELTTAMPYFAFLAILFNYHLTFLQVTFILVVYNIIYMLPLMILYFIYIKTQDRFDNIYSIIKTQVAKWSNILVPTLVFIIGLILIYHSVSLLLK